MPASFFFFFPFTWIFGLRTSTKLDSLHFFFLKHGTSKSKRKRQLLLPCELIFFFSIARNILTDSNSKFQMIQRISEEVSIVFLFLFLFFLMTLSFKTKSEVTITVFPYPTPFPLYFPYCFTLTTWWIVMGRRKII